MKKIEPVPGVVTFQMVERPFTTKTGKEGCQRVKAIVLTEAQEDWLRRWFPEVENARLMAASGLKMSALHRFARQLGLTKSEKGIRGIKKRQAAHIRRVCEKNGWYASLRGRPPSDACRQATARMWQEIREGKREHPARIMKRTHPRKYRQWMKRKSEARKESIRKEVQRIVYGLERKTRLRVAACKYTKSQVCHRYNAAQRGYILTDDCSEQGGERYNIYYDSETKRAPIFERNLLRDGFQLKPWVD